jgi:CRP/FNR family transcriptional regulator, cyclic AMP receptor protein
MPPIMLPVDPLLALAHAPLFRGSSPSDFEALRPAIRTQTYRKGQYIWRTGDAPTAAYVLMSGQINVSRLGPGGEEFVVDVFLPGDTFGEFSVFDGRPRIVDCVAVEPTICLAVERGVLLDFLERNPRLTLKILAGLSRRIRDQDLYRSETAFQNISGRVALTLITLADSHGERVADGVRVPARISQTTLANMVGASRENVNRALSRLIKLGHIRRRGATIIIPKLEELRTTYSWLGS